MDDEASPVPITAAPRKDQLVEHDGKVFKTVQEGKAYILVPPNARTLLDPNASTKADDGSQVQNVFYNPIQQFNRDLSVLAIKAFGEDVCRRKQLKHEQQRERNRKNLEKKQERKRKREEETVEDASIGENGVKTRKAGDGSPILAQNGEPSAEEAGEANPGTARHGMDLGAAEDGGVRLKTGEAAVTSSEDAAPATTTVENEQGPFNDTNGDVSNDSTNPPQWQPRFRILDALSATGLRALRYASEIPRATAIVANDRDANAAKNIKLNVEHNQLASSITTTTGDALAHMYGIAFPSPHSHGPRHVSGKYDVIDLDPYGTAATFIDAALQALEDGGMLCVTCTDSGVFASCGYSEKTFALYGGMPIKGSHSHEGGLRLILQSIATSAAKSGIAIEPLLSLSIDFYVRLFIRVRKSAQEVKFLAGKTMMVYGCDHGCGAWNTQFLGRHSQQNINSKQPNWKYSIAQAPNADRLCEHCGSKMHVAGPMWGGHLHNPAFIERILDTLPDLDGEVYRTKPRIEGMLTTAIDELAVNADTMDYRPVVLNKAIPDIDETDRHLIPQTPPESLDHHPFFFIPSALCKVIKAVAPPEDLVKGALRYAGYRATRSHCKPGSIKTDAPWSVIWEVMREWVRQKSPIKEGAVKEGTAGWKILQSMRKDDLTNGEAPAAEEEHVEAQTAEETNGVVNEGPTSTLRNRIDVVFDKKLGKDRPGKRLVRYQMNPRENWGPMSKAKGSAR